MLSVVAYSNSCCAAHGRRRPTAVAAVLRMRGDIPQLWLLCVHRRSNRFFTKLSTKFVHNQAFQKRDISYAHYFNTNAMHITELIRYALMKRFQVWGVEFQGREIGIRYLE